MPDGRFYLMNNAVFKKLHKCKNLSIFLILIVENNTHFYY